MAVIIWTDTLSASLSCNSAIAGGKEVVRINLRNTLNLVRENELISLDLEALQKSGLNTRDLVILNNSKSVTYQIEGNKIIFTSDFDPRESKAIEIIRRNSTKGKIFVSPVIETIDIDTGEINSDFKQSH